MLCYCDCDCEGEGEGEGERYVRTYDTELSVAIGKRRGVKNGKLVEEEITNNNTR